MRTLHVVFSVHLCGGEIMRGRSTMWNKTFPTIRFEKWHESTVDYFRNENAAVCEYAQEIISIFPIATVAKCYKATKFILQNCQINALCAFEMVICACVIFV